MLIRDFGMKMILQFELLTKIQSWTLTFMKYEYGYKAVVSDNEVTKNNFAQVDENINHFFLIYF